MRGNTEKAPSGVDTAAAVGKYRESSCGSGYCCGSGKNSWGGECGGDGEERLLWGFGGVF